MFVNDDGSIHVYAARLGPLGIFLIVLTIGIVFAIMLVLVLGAFLIWILLVGLLIAAAISSGLLWRYFSRLH
jgi:hypothetical protein